MRKIGCYGYNKWPINFEFPTAQDLLQMPKNKAIKVKDLKYDKASYFSANDWWKCFSGFQLILSNGVSSPVFTYSGYKARKLKSFDIPDYSLVKRVNGTEQNYWKSRELAGLSFAKKDGTEITKVVMINYTFEGETMLADDEEIIGIYGTKDHTKGDKWFA